MLHAIIDSPRCSNQAGHAAGCYRVQGDDQLSTHR